MTDLVEDARPILGRNEGVLVRKLTTARTGLRGVAVLALVASVFGAVSAPSAQAGARLPAAETANPLVEPVPEPTEGIVGSFGIVEDADAKTSDDPPLGDNPDAGSSTSADERFKAAAVLGWVPRGELGMSDKDFVIVLWEKADDYFHPEVKKGAKEAFADMVDVDASAEFIKAGIFAANSRDAALKVIRAQRDTARLSAAQEVGWLPADDDARRSMLRSANSGFLFALGQKAEAESEVRKGAHAVVEASEEQQLAFIDTGVHAAAKTDRDNKIAAGKQKEIDEAQAKVLRDIKAAAIAMALGRVATQFELEHSTDRDLVYKIKTEAAGVQVKAAGVVAYGSDKPEDWRAFLAAGVHVARAADIAERDRAEAAEDERKVREILNNAKFDKYQPRLAAAANQALQGNATARSLFISEGQNKAAELDVAQPSGYMTIALQGSASKRCLQVVGAADKPNLGANADKAFMELSDCNENARQRWGLIPIGGGRYALQSANSKKCLEVPAGKNSENVRLIQNKCAASNQQYWTFVDTGKSTKELLNVASNKVTTVFGSGTANGSAVIQANNTHILDQQWRVIDFSHHQMAVPPLVGKIGISGLLAGKCLQVAGSTSKPNEGANADMATMELYTCDDATARQTWEFVPIAGNRFALKNALRGKCLDILGGSVAPRGQVIQYACHMRPSEQWVLMSAGKQRSFMLRNALTGTYADVRNSGTANGSVVHAWPFTGKDNQRWVQAGLRTAQPVG